MPDIKSISNSILIVVNLASVVIWIALPRCTRATNAEIQAVSSFYGPGAVLAVLITAASVLLKEARIPYLFIENWLYQSDNLEDTSNLRCWPTHQPRHETQQIKDTKGAGLDIDLMAIAAYFVTAAVDYVFHSRSENKENIAQFEAAGQILDISYILSAISGCLDPDDIYISTSRRLVWTAITVVTFTAKSQWSSLINFGVIWDPQNLIAPLGCILIAVYSMSKFVQNNPSAQEPPVYDAFASLLVVSVGLSISYSVLSFFWRPWTCENAPVRLSLPKTGAKLSDLDQGAALGAAIITVLLPFASHAIIWFKKHITHWIQNNIVKQEQRHSPNLSNASINGQPTSLDQLWIEMTSTRLENMAADEELPDVITSS